MYIKKKKKNKSTRNWRQVSQLEGGKESISQTDIR